MKKANETVWVDKDGVLQPAGNPEAVMLFATEGDEVSDASVEGRPGAATFFTHVTPVPVEPPVHCVRPPTNEPGESNVEGALRGGPEEKVGPVKTMGVREEDDEEEVEVEEEDHVTGTKTKKKVKQKKRR